MKGGYTKNNEQITRALRPWSAVTCWGSNLFGRSSNKDDLQYLEEQWEHTINQDNNIEIKKQKSKEDKD